MYIILTEIIIDQSIFILYNLYNLICVVIEVFSRLYY